MFWYVCLSLALLQLQQAQAGFLCLQCTDVVQPTDCDTVTICGAHEKCYVDAKVSTFGSIRYDLGCRDALQCDQQQQGKRLVLDELQNLNLSEDERRQANDLFICFQCCAGDTCNKVGCGYTAGYPDPIGPICFNCAGQAKTNDCNKITMCSQDQVCLLQKTRDPVTHQDRYETKCESEQVCREKVTMYNDISSSLIGKKRGSESFVSGGVCLIQCCNTDMCNNNCSHSNGTSILTPGSLPPIVPTKPTTMAQSLDPCLSNPCHRGICFSYKDTFNCSCDIDVFGRNCDQVMVPTTSITTIPVLHTNKDPCISSPCANGTCLQYLNTYKCKCEHGFWGRNCENVDGGWSDWHPWTSCSVSCGKGTRTRLRNCTNPVPQNSGNYCEKPDSYLGLEPCETSVCRTTDCYDLLNKNSSATSGPYTIELWKSKKLIIVHCDMETDGGGWTIFQNRYDGSVDFYRNFTEYVNGFGNLNGEFWLGLEYLHEMSSQGLTDFRMDLMAADGQKLYTVFHHFSISDGPLYVLYARGSTGTEVHHSHVYGLGYSLRNQFSTFDKNAASDSAKGMHGAWWYKGLGYCMSVNLNGKYCTPGTICNKQGMYYFDLKGYESLQSSRLMFRRV